MTYYGSYRNGTFIKTKQNKNKQNKVCGYNFYTSLRKIC